MGFIALETWGSTLQAVHLAFSATPDPSEYFPLLQRLDFLINLGRVSTLLPFKHALRTVAASGFFAGKSSLRSFDVAIGGRSDSHGFFLLDF